MEWSYYEWYKQFVFVYEWNTVCPWNAPALLNFDLLTFNHNIKIEETLSRKTCFRFFLDQETKLQEGLVEKHFSFFAFW